MEMQWEGGLGCLATCEGLEVAMKPVGGDLSKNGLLCMGNLYCADCTALELLTWMAGDRPYAHGLLPLSHSVPRQGAGLQPGAH